MMFIEYKFPLAFFGMDIKFKAATLYRLGTEIKQTAIKSMGNTRSLPGQPPGKRTGTLAKSIKVFVEKDKNSVKVVAGAHGKKSTTPEGKKIKLAYYAAALEGGATGVGRPSKKAKIAWKRDPKNRKKKGNRIPGSGTLAPRPYLEPAAAKVFETAAPRMLKAIETGISFKATKDSGKKT